MTAYSNKVLRKLQLTQLEILTEVVRICHSNKLRYYLIGGTLLGAIRHKGFIPWDDDLDIAMPRKDFVKFISICPSELNSCYFLHYYTADFNYYLPFAKVRKNGTLYSEPALKNLQCHKGIFIDIFPIDNAPHKYSIIQFIQAKIMKFISALKLYKIGITKKPSNKLKIAAFFTSKMSMRKLSIIEEKIMTLYNKKQTKYYVNLGSNYNFKKQTFEKDIYDEPVLVMFEKKQFYAPKNWEFILKQIYGDYMKLPPVEKRGKRHNVVKIDFGEERDSNEKV